MSTKQPCEIKVDGEAEILLPPERAILKVLIRTTSVRKSSSTSGTIDSARKIEARLRELSEKSAAGGSKLPDIDYWSRTSLNETSHAPYVDGKTQPTQYTATVDFSVQLQTFRKLGSLIHDLVSIPNVSSKGVDWVLTPETQTAQHSKLRTLAAKNAVEKARDYATALGYESVVPFELHGAMQYVHSSSMKGRRMTREVPDGKVATQAKNMAQDDEQWEDVAEEAFQYAPEEVKMTQSVACRFNAK